MAYDDRPPPRRRFDAAGSNGVPYQRQYASDPDPAEPDPASYGDAGYPPAGYDPTGYDPTGSDPAGYGATRYDPGGQEPDRYEPSSPEQPGPDRSAETDLWTGASYRPLSHRSTESRADAFASVDTSTNLRATAGEAAADAPAEESAGADSGPDEARPRRPRDRLLVHWVWELVLALVVAGLAYLVWQSDPDQLRGDRLSGLLVLVGAYGLLGLGAGATLRAGVPNLAIGPVAVAAMIYFGQRGGEGVLLPTIFATGAALVLGAAVAVLVLALRVPGWAASLAAAVAVLVWIQLQPSEVELTGFFDPVPHGTTLFLVVAAVGMVGGALAAIPVVRDTVGGRRPTGDPADAYGGGLAATVAAGAIMVSMMAAVPAGVLLASSAGRPVVASAGLELTVLGLAVALIGGTSVFGRRGGVFGGTLAVIAVVLFQTYQAEQGWRISLLAIAAGGMVIGLGVSRLIELLGRRRVTVVEEAEPEPPPPPLPRRVPAAEAEPARPVPSSSWPSPHDSWSSSLPTQPAQPVHGHADPWGDDDWRSR